MTAFTIIHRELMAKLEAKRYDICFIDLMLGTGDDCAGLELIPLAAAKGIYAVVMSALDSEDTVAKARV